MGKQKACQPTGQVEKFPLLPVGRIHFVQNGFDQVNLEENLTRCNLPLP